MPQLVRWPVASHHPPAEGRRGGRTAPAPGAAPWLPDARPHTAPGPVRRLCRARLRQREEQYVAGTERMTGTSPARRIPGVTRSYPARSGRRRGRRMRPASRTVTGSVRSATSRRAAERPGRHQGRLPRHPRRLPARRAARRRPAGPGDGPRHARDLARAAHRPGHHRAAAPPPPWRRPAPPGGPTRPARAAGPCRRSVPPVRRAGLWQSVSVRPAASEGRRPAVSEGRRAAGGR